MNEIYTTLRVNVKFSIELLCTFYTLNVFKGISFKFPLIRIMFESMQSI